MSIPFNSAIPRPAPVPDKPRHRIGKFKASREFVFNQSPQRAIVFANVVPIQAEWDYSGTVTYTAISHLFSEIEEGEAPPLYELTITRTDPNTLTLNCQRRPNQ